MKVRVFSKGQGWYVSATNYKDKQDKAYMNLHFSQNHCLEPIYEDNGRGFSVQELDIQEAIFTSYKGKIGMTIFKYEQLTDIDLNKETQYQQTSLTGTNRDITGHFGGEDYGFEQEEPPFY